MSRQVTLYTAIVTLSSEEAHNEVSGPCEGLWRLLGLEFLPLSRHSLTPHLRFERLSLVNKETIVG